MRALEQTACVHVALCGRKCALKEALWGHDEDGGRRFFEALPKRGRRSQLRMHGINFTSSRVAHAWTCLWCRLCANLMGVCPILGVLGAQPERMVWVMMRKMVDDGEVAKMHGFLRKHGVKKKLH